MPSDPGVSVLKVSSSHFDLLIWAYKSWRHFWGEFGGLSCGWMHSVGFPQSPGRALQVLAVGWGPPATGALADAGAFRQLVMDLPQSLSLT